MTPVSSVLPQLITAAIVGIVSPVAIMGAIALLASRRPVANTLAFLAGWNVFLIVLAVIIQALFGGHHAATDPSAKAAVNFVLGVLLLVMGLRNLIGASNPLKDAVTPAGEQTAEPTGPKWLSQVRDAGPVKAAAFGMLTIAISPGNVAVFLSASQGLAGATIDSSTRLIATILLLGAISLAILIPLGIYVLVPRRADAVLGRLRSWLNNHDRMLVACVLLVFGVVLLIKSLVTLL